jgi:hypothetical protein|tara:strand:+ start:1122 stop:1361 length:240 start_codon:yes stop_codon:yes gene_type:complete
MGTKIIISEKQLKRIVNNQLQEHSWQKTDDEKWSLLEKDLRFVVDKIIDKHKSNWGNDQYAVIGAIEQIFEGMFAKVGR